jgi:hypothetical protein
MVSRLPTRASIEEFPPGKKPQIYLAIRFTLLYGFPFLFNDYRPPHFSTGRTLKSCEYHWNVREVGPQTATSLLMPYSSPSILFSDEHWITPSLQFRFQRTYQNDFWFILQIYGEFFFSPNFCQRFLYFFSLKSWEIFFISLFDYSTNIWWYFNVAKFLSEIFIYIFLLEVYWI